MREKIEALFNAEWKKDKAANGGSYREWCWGWSGEYATKFLKDNDCQSFEAYEVLIDLINEGTY
jgi:hypothetical protein